MEGYEPPTYGNRIADIYDELYGQLFDVDATVDFLAGIAGDGPALELAIGTGRIALPLASRGIEVHGIDISEAMVAKLRAKPGGDKIPVTIGDFADVGVDGQFPLIFVAFNTLFALTTQEDQIRCFRNVSDRLAPNGVFVIEAFVPDLSRFDRHQRVSVERLGLDDVQLEASRHDPAAQKVESQHVVISGDDVSLYPVHLRYAWPSELDLMARLAGLRLRDRFGGWKGEAFDSSSQFHVSVYERGEVTA
ncbi:MAG: class I SAM-dependent DNA methyltransferase [Actinomycetota bacterium]